MAATTFNLTRQGQPWPLLVAGIGAAVVGYAIFGTYDPVIEGLGFATLIGGVGLDLYLIHRAELCP